MKTLNQYIKESLLDDEDDLVNDDNTVLINKFLNDNYNIKGTYTINKNNEVDVNGDILIKNNELKYLTNDLFTFGVVTGDFKCTDAGIISLKGGPKIVEKSFACNYCNKLESLEGAPKEVGGFVCSFCGKIKNLKGAPEKVNGAFLCARCASLESLKGAPKYVKGWFNCTGNNSLKSLKGLETKIGFEFSCSDCKNLTSLDCPNASIDDDFICHNCTMLFSLKGMPKYIGRSFSIKGCFNISDLTPLKTANIKKNIYGPNGNIIDPKKIK